MREPLDDPLAARHHQQVPCSPPEPAAHLAATWLKLLLLTCPAVIFVMPFYFPVAPAFSESFLFGFNNRAALLLTLALGVLLAWLSWRGLLRFRYLDQPLTSGSSNPTRRLPGAADLAASLFLAAVLSLVLFLLLRPGHGSGDAIYFLDRIGLLAQGLRPFHDFEFVYGPLQLYAPWLAARILHLSLTDAYSLVWLLSTLLGLTALWLAVRRLAAASPDLPVAGSRATFLILAAMLGSELLSFGLNYNPLRYAAPIACLLLVERLSRTPQPTLTSSRNTLLAVTLSAILLIGLSPEIGVTFSIAILGFLPLRRRAFRQPWAGFAVTLGFALGLILFAFFHLGVFETMRDFSAGSFNLPILPGPHILLFLAAFAVNIVWLTQPGHRDRLLSPIALLALYSLGMLPAALGRCDWAHVLGYELGTILSALLLLAAHPFTRRLSQAALVAVFLLMFLRGLTGTIAMAVKVQLYPILARISLTADISPATSLSDRIAQQIVARTRQSLVQSFGPAEAAHKLDRIHAVAHLSSADPHTLFPAASPVLYAPFSYSPQRLGNFQSSAIAEGHFMGALNILTPAQVFEKIAEMQAHPEQDLLLSPDGLEQCAPLRGDPAALRSLFLLPLVPAPRNQYALTAPICQYIYAHYRILTPPSPQTGDYALWRHQPATP